MPRKLLAATGLLLGIAGFIIFLALAVGTWVVRRDADREVAAAAEKAHQAGDVAARVIVLIREVIARANASLNAARSETMQLTPEAEQDPLVRMAMWKAKRDLPGEVEKARDAVGIASETVIVAGAALEVFGEQHHDEAALGVEQGGLQAARTQLDDAARELKNARTVLGVSIPGSATPEQLTRVDQALTLATQVTDQSDRALVKLRSRVDKVQQQAEWWSLRAAIAISALSGLAGLGQVFLVRSCWRGLKNQSESSTAHHK